MSSSETNPAARRTLTALPFRPHASVSCPSPADLAISLAWELGPLDPDPVERALAALAAAVPAKRGAKAQLRALGRAVPTRAPSRCPRHRIGVDDLMIDKVLESGQGHSLTLAVVAAEVGRRARVPVGIVDGAAGHFVAHHRLTEPLVLDPAAGRLVDARELGPLEWRCGHQIAAELLDALQPRYERSGDLSRALQVARLRCTLPFEDMAPAEQRLRTLTARLN